ncbi:MAG: triple tyrosine motif-containing protein [Bacteroidota bacterium]
MFRVIFSCLWLLVASSLIGQAPNLRIATYSIEEGISSRLVTRIQKDDLGFVWLATPTGLNRFDGYEFLHFSTHSKELGVLSADYIQEITPYKDEKLTIFYHRSLTFFDFINPRTFEVNQVQVNAETGVIGEVLSLFAQKRGAVYVLSQTEGQLFIAQLNDQNQFTILHKMPIEERLDPADAHLTVLRNGDCLLFLGKLGVCLINKSGNQWVSVEGVPFERNGLLHQTYLKQSEGGATFLSIAESTGVFKWNTETLEFEKFETPAGEQHLSKLWEDDAGNLLFGQTLNSINPGVFEYHLLDTQNRWKDFSFFTQIGKYNIDLESPDFYEMAMVATDVSFKIVKNNAAVISNYLNGGNNSGSRNNIMREIVRGPNHSLFIAQEDGPWWEYDLRTKQLTPREVLDEQTKRPIELDCSMNLSYDSISNCLWGFTCESDYGGGKLLKVNIDTWEAKSYPFKKKIRSMCRTADGQFWLVGSLRDSDTEVYSFDEKTGIAKLYTNEEGLNPVANAYPTFIKSGKNQQVYVGTSKGLFIINAAKKTVDFISKADELSDNFIEALLELPNNELLIGTARGLNFFNTKTKENRILTKEDGLSANHIYELIQGSRPNTFWISTILGLNFYDATKNVFKRFYEQDGLTHNEFNRFSVFRDENNQFIFGGVNGLNVFSEAALLEGSVSPTPFLSRIKYFDTKANETVVQQTNLTMLDRITLRPSDRYLQLFFALDDYSSPKNNQFQYKLEGYDLDWQLLEKGNQLTYNSLPAGTYKLLVKGAGLTGNWSKEPLGIEIEVQQIFYKKWQFWLFCGVLLAILLQLFNKYQLEQQLKVERIRTKLSSDLHDEVSGLLSGIAMQSELLEMTTSDEQNRPKLEKITQTSRSAMSRMSDVIWSIDARKSSVSDLLDRMTEHAMDMLEPIGVHWDLKVENVNRKSKLPVLLRENLYFIYKEAINNVVKHANASKVSILFANRNGQFILSVQNDGTPKNSDQKSYKKGQGTSNMVMRAKKIKAHLNIETDNEYTVTLKRKQLA